jgi:hypothetical protein
MDMDMETDHKNTVRDPDLDLDTDAVMDMEDMDMNTDMETAMVVNTDHRARNMLGQDTFSKI